MEVQIRCLAIVQQFRAGLRLFDGRVYRRSVYTRANVVRKCDKVYTHVPDASPSSSRANLHGYLKLGAKHEIKSRKTPDYDIHPRLTSHHASNARGILARNSTIEDSLTYVEFSSLFHYFHFNFKQQYLFLQIKISEALSTECP